MKGKPDYIKIINDCIVSSGDDDNMYLLPMTLNKLIGNDALIDQCQDLVCDMLVIHGFDEKYEVTEYGRFLEETIGFLTRLHDR